MRHNSRAVRASGFGGLQAPDDVRREPGAVVVAEGVLQYQLSCCGG